MECPFQVPARPRGVAVLLVLMVLAATLALAYAMSHSSLTMAKLSARESSAVQAGSAVDSSVNPILDHFRLNANWMPASNPIVGKLDSGERYQVSVKITESGAGRTVEAAAQVLDQQQKDYVTLADRHLTIRLTKQVRNDRPTSAIAAFARTVSSSSGPPVYVANGNTIRGNVRSKGPIYFQAGFVLQGTAYVMGTVTRQGTGTSGYVNYRASWGKTYQAGSLSELGTLDSTGRLYLNNVVLGPSSTNPMGVFYYDGTEVVLGDNVTVNGTLALRGNLTVSGSGVRLVALQQAQVPAGDPTGQGVPTDSGGTGLQVISASPSSSLISLPVTTIAETTGDETTVKTTFPAVVVDGSIVFTEGADVVRVSGLLLAGRNVRREKGKGSALLCDHNHSLPLDSLLNPLATADGPAIYIRGAIMAARVSLEHIPERPLALVYDAAVTYVVDAPGFFSWRVQDWTEAN